MRSLPEVKLLRRFKTPANLRASGKSDMLRAMMRLLPAEQRRLAEMVILNRVSHRAAAASLHVSPGAITRRVHSLRNRLSCPVRRALATHLDTLPEPARSLAVEHFFGGVSQVALAAAFDLPHREIANQLQYVRGWLRALNRQRRAERAALAKAGSLLPASERADFAPALSA